MGHNNNEKRSVGLSGPVSSSDDPLATQKRVDSIVRGIQFCWLRSNETQDRRPGHKSSALWGVR